MLHIAVCDDDTEAVKSHKEIAQNCLRQNRNAGKITVYIANGVSKVRKSLHQVYEELEAEEFIYIDRGCIVNIIHILCKSKTAWLLSPSCYP